MLLDTYVGREKLLAMTTTVALRLHLYYLSSSSSSDKVCGEFAKLVHPE